MTSSSQSPPRLGAAITLDQLSRDPYPVYARLRANEPVSWIDELKMWYVTRYDDVQVVLGDPQRYTTRSENSTIFDTFGAHMLTSEGEEQRRVRSRGGQAPHGEHGP